MAIEVSAEDRAVMGTPQAAKAALIEAASKWRELRQPLIANVETQKRCDVDEREARFQLANAAVLWLWHEEHPLTSALALPQETTTEKLGRFDHHPDPAIDFCVEVECIEGMVKDLELGLLPSDENEQLPHRIAKAMQFRVGGDEGAVNAKRMLREYEDRYRAIALPGARAGGEPPVAWRKDGFGKEEHALFIGDLYVGHIMSAQPSLRGQWRGWFACDEDGEETGWFSTADEARQSVEAALSRALSAIPAPPTEDSEDV